MNLTDFAPEKPRSPRPYAKRIDWSPLLIALAAKEPLAWISLPLADIPGDLVAQKQSRLIQVARRHIGRIQTQTAEGILFVRRLPPPTEKQS